MIVFYSFQYTDTSITTSTRINTTTESNTNTNIITTTNLLQTSDPRSDDFSTEATRSRKSGRTTNNNQQTIKNTARNYLKKLIKELMVPKCAGQRIDGPKTPWSENWWSQNALVR